jgi:hypothetical protein
VKQSAKKGLFPVDTAPKDELIPHKPDLSLMRRARKGEIDWSEDTKDRLIEEIYACHGVLGVACGRLGLSWDAVQKKIERDPELRRSVAWVRAFVNQEIEYQYMQRVLDPSERNPAWKIFYMKHKLEDFYEGKAAPNPINILISDSATRRADVVEGKVVREIPAETNEHQSGPVPPVDTAPDTAGSP